MTSQDMRYLELREEIDSQHEAMTQRVLHEQPNMGIICASLRAMKLILQEERQKYCNIKLLT